MIEPCRNDTEVADSSIELVAVNVIYLPSLGDTANPRTRYYHMNSDRRVTAPYKWVLRVAVGSAHDRCAAARMLLGPVAVGIFLEDLPAFKRGP